MPQQQNGFSYTYCTAQNQEVLRIRNKYLPREETKLEELRRLDRLVQTSGTIESLCAGVGGCLIFGLGLCLGMEVIGRMVWLGVILGLVGIGAMAVAYPIYRKCLAKAKQRHSPRILELLAELSPTNS